jgi:hypothetical protein
MAVTGRTHLPVEPGRRKTGAYLQSLPEGSSQTYPRGGLLIRSGGFIVMHTTSNVSVSLYGIAARSGGNKTADNLAKAAVWRFQPDQPFKAVVSGVLSASQLGATIALSQNTAGKVFAITAAAASDSSVGRIVDFADGFVSGDTNPVILFVPLVAKIQES